MSAITGICECCAISGSASASSWLGQATRTMSQPVAVSSAICWSVALTSEVSVVVIDCTEIGRVAADADLADLDLAGLAARGEHRRRRRGHAQADRGHGFSLRRRDGAVESSRTSRGAGVRRGRRRSARRPSRAGTTPRRRRSAAAWRRRRSPGRAGRAAGRSPRRSASQSAPAMWPPSSGSSGMKLNMPMKKLKPAISISRKTAFSVTGKLVVRHGLAGEPAAADDADRAVGGRAPRRRRSPRPTPQTLTGRVPSASTVSLRSSCPSARACRPGRRWSPRRG